MRPSTQQHQQLLCRTLRQISPSCSIAPRHSQNGYYRNAIHRPALCATSHLASTSHDRRKQTHNLHHHRNRQQQWPHVRSHFNTKGYHTFGRCGLSTTTTTATTTATTEDINAKDTGELSASYDFPDKGQEETGLYRLLDKEQRRVLHEQRALVAWVRRLARHDVGLEATEATNTQEASVLEESVFCIVLAGEFNAGKTTILNALMGERLLETGALPTTDAITILSANPPPPKAKTTTAVQYHQVTDSDLLHDLTLVDTPGTNAVLLDHTATTMRLLPSADLILFCTSADRPFPESERQLLAGMAADYRKRIVVIINKMDLLQTAGGDHGHTEKQRVVDFVTEHTQQWLGARPLVLAISAQDALSAKLNHKAPEALTNSSLWQRSRFAELEAFLRSNLTTKTKIQAKLLNPIGLVDKLLEDCFQKLAHEQEELQTDVSTLQLLESQVQAWQSELDRQMKQTRQDVRTSWQQEANRGHVLLRRMSWGEYYHMTLWEPSQLQRRWQETSSLVTHVALTDPQAVRTWIHETAQGLAVRSRAQGQALMEFLGTRPSSSRQNKSLVGHVLAASRFEEIQQTLTQQLQQAVDRHGPDDNQTAVDQMLQRLIQVTRVSVALQGSALPVALATSMAWIDVLWGTGTAMALFGAGSAIVWQGRQLAVNTYRDRWTRRGEILDETLVEIGGQITARVQRRIQDGISPYQQFVQAEQERLQRLESSCHDAQVTARRLRNRIGKL